MEFKEDGDDADNKAGAVKLKIRKSCWGGFTLEINFKTGDENTWTEAEVEIINLYGAENSRFRLVLN